MQLFSRVVCTIFLSLCFFSQAYAVTVPSEEVYFNEVGTRGQHRSLVAACQASMPKVVGTATPKEDHVLVIGVPVYTKCR